MSHQELNQALNQVGLKATGPRMKILAILARQTERHLSAEAIYQLLREQKENIGLATVYRVLTQFEAAGLVIRHNFSSDHAVFELNEGEHHDHLICVRCGRVEEFVDAVIEKHQSKIAEKAGFKMLDHRLDLYGICRDCRANEKQRA
ncbi:MAG: ferric iron uptake transcriptional regulator [Pseudomonadota bacterium]